MRLSGCVGFFDRYLKNQKRVGKSLLAVAQIGVDVERSGFPFLHPDDPFAEPGNGLVEGEQFVPFAGSEYEAVQITGFVLDDGRIVGLNGLSIARFFDPVL